MTLEQLREIEDVYVGPNEIADVLRTSPQTIRKQAQEDPSKLGFPVIVLQSRVIIPRKGFLFFLDNGHPKGIA